jgi:transcriptional regulator with XRE-family HTH domain
MRSVHWLVVALHKARAEDGMTCDEVGARIGRSGGSVSAWERGDAEPGLAQVEAWAATHGLYLTLTPDRPQPAPLAAKAAEVVMVVRVRRMLQSGEARRIREAAGLSVKEAGAAAGVDGKAVHNWECGRTRPQASTAALYGRFLLALDRALTLTPGAGAAA